MFSNIGTGEILVIALVALLIFGPNKLPELLQSLGKGLRQFKKAMNDVETEIKDSINSVNPLDSKDDTHTKKS